MEKSRVFLVRAGVLLWSILLKDDLFFWFHMKLYEILLNLLVMTSVKEDIFGEKSRYRRN